MENSRVAGLKIHELQKLLNQIIDLEKTGRYSEAIDHLKGIWDDISELPDVEGLSPLLAAEIYLRCGSVLSYLGNSKQILDAQDRARDLITTAREEFEKLYKIEKVAECENRLGLTYFHKGEYPDAHIWIDISLSHNLSETCETRLHSYVIKALIFLEQRNYEAIISTLNAVKKNFENTTFLLQGSFATNIGLAYKNIGKMDDAIRFLQLAKHSHQRSKHLPYLATTENNLAQLYRLKFDFITALKYAENAIKLFTEIGDRARIAYAMDTKAEVLIDKKDFDIAVEVLNEAIEMLRFGDNAGILSDIYLTKSRALVGAGKLAEAVLAVTESIITTKTTGNSKEKQIAESFELSLVNKYPVVTKKIYSEKQKIPDDLELQLPPEILPNQEFFGVWIKNRDFEKIGLKKGNLAIVVKSKVERGNLVAVHDNETDLVTIGFYENHFGLIGLENFNRETEILDEVRTTIIGKIIGYANDLPNENGCYEVKPVTLEKN